MCAEYSIHAKTEALLEALDRGTPPDQILPENLERHVRISNPAPVIRLQKGHLHFQEMHFSLKPPGTPYPTFNARLSSWDEKHRRLIPIFEKPTWRKPMAEGRCLVPMTDFVEPVYIGDHAGYAMRFFAEEGEPLFAAGLCDETVNPKTGEIYQGFAPILHTPSAQVLRIGHHRLLVFLKPRDAREWISDHLKTAEEAYEFLRDRRFVPELAVARDRALGKGWEKRVSENRQKHERELAQEKFL